jgi:Ni/Co efflux regulator RcnB
MEQRRLKEEIKGDMYAQWDGEDFSSMTRWLLRDQDPYMRTALGISDEQHQKFEDMWSRGRPITDPEHMKLVMVDMDVRSRAQNDPNMAVDEELANRYFEARRKARAWDIIPDHEDTINLLTPEQIRKIREIQLSLMGEQGLFSPDTYDVLNLTDAQKQEMQKIKKELEPEFEKNLEIIANGQVILSTIDRELRKGSLDIEEQNRSYQKLKELPEYKRIMAEKRNIEKAFSAKFRTRMFDVLTDEQWARLQNLIDNPPRHALVFLDKLRERRGESEKADGWQPGPNSWRPGDPIPEEYRQERNTRKRFPREEN